MLTEEVQKLLFTDVVPLRQAVTVDTLVSQTLQDRQIQEFVCE